MRKYSKILTKILSGANDNSIAFDNLCKLLINIGFHQRIKGDHHIFFKNDIEEIINIQPKGKTAKPYQVKQIRKLILKHKLGETNEQI